MSDEKEKPSFFAVIPASVRYDKRLQPGAKLLYGEISALCNKEGYCWAGNAYFAELYNTNERTIRNWIKSLSEAEHILISFSYVPGKKEIQSRIIKLFLEKNAESAQRGGEKNFPTSESPEGKNGSDESDVGKNSSTGGENNYPTPGKNFPYVGKESSTGGENNYPTPGKNFPYVGKESSTGGENNCRDNTTSINTTTTPASDPPEKAATEAITPDELKKAICALDPTLILANFYPRAAELLNSNALDHGYLKWVYRQCKQKKDAYSFNGLYYKLFLDEAQVEMYKAHVAKINASSAPPPPPPDISCPVCGTSHSPLDAKCPGCGLPHNAPPERVAVFKRLLEFPADKRSEYFRRENFLLDECGKDFVKYREKIASLNREFGMSEAS